MIFFPGIEWNHYQNNNNSIKKRKKTAEERKGFVTHVFVFSFLETVLACNLLSRPSALELRDLPALARVLG